MKVNRQFERHGPLWVPRYDADTPGKRYERYLRRQTERRKFRAAIAFVQQAVGVGTTGSATATLGSGVTSGNLLVACIGFDTSVSAVSSVTGGNVTWSQVAIAQPIKPAGNGGVAIWQGINSSGGGTSIVVTVNASDNVNFNVSEWSGIATSSPLDGSAVTATLTTGSTSPATGNYTSTNANDLIIANCGFHDAATMSTRPGSPWTSLTDGGTVGIGTGESYQIVSSTGTYSATWTISTSTYWGAIICGFKAAGGAAFHVDEDPYVSPRPWPIDPINMIW